MPPHSLAVRTHRHCGQERAQGRDQNAVGCPEGQNHRRCPFTGVDACRIHCLSVCDTSPQTWRLRTVHTRDLSFHRRGAQGGPVRPVLGTSWSCSEGISGAVASLAWGPLRAWGPLLHSHSCAEPVSLCLNGRGPVFLVSVSWGWLSTPRGHLPPAAPGPLHGTTVCLFEARGRIAGPGLHRIRSDLPRALALSMNSVN